LQLTDEQLCGLAYGDVCTFYYNWNADTVSKEDQLFISE